MTMSRLVVLALLIGAGSATGADLSAPALPTLAADPSSAPASPWSGFYAGTSAFAIAGGHHASAVGGAATFGYYHAFDNHLVVGIEGTTGLARGSFGRGGLNGFDFAGTNVKLGYDMGRVMPYVFAGVDVAKPTFRNHVGFTGSSDTLNDLFAGSRGLKPFTTVGAGVDYAVTDRLTMGFAVSASQSHGTNGAYPPGPAGAVLP